MVKRVLPNGLTVLVQENHAAPVVAVRMYVRTGSIYEGQYLGTGISHLFEHALSEGTKTRTKEQINDDVQGMGGQSNAYTSYDVTAYHITTASSYFERALNSLSDEMQNATFPESEVKVQQGIIHNEMNMGEDDPNRAISKLYYETAFRVHPVRYPIIGHRQLFDRLTQNDILTYYKTHYTPENTVVAVAGDVNAEAALASIATAFGTWERRSPATPTLPQEPRQSSPRRAVLEKDVNLSYLQMGWHTIPLQHPDLYALDTLAQILGGGESSRLVRDLREKQNLVSSVTSYSSTPNYNAGVFAVRATLPPGNEAKVENAVWSHVGRMWREGVSAAELERAKKQIETTFVFNSTSVEDQAEQMAYDELGTGDPTYSRRYVAGIKAVTAEQVQAVAKKYLTREGVTTAILKPRVAGGTAKNTTKKAAVSAPKLVRLSNGMRLIIRENHATPTVSIVAMGAGGARLEPARKAGLANIFAEMLTRGTKKRSAEQIASLVDDMGASLEPFSGYNAWGLQSQWLSRDWRRGLSLVGESMLQPTFPADELARVKNQTAARIKAQNDDPMGAASLLLRRTYFGNHPYGRAAIGTAATVGGITPADLQAYWNSVMLPRSVVLSIYGDVNAAEVQAAAENMFQKFDRSGVLPP
ncbi:MAG TPA: pitrilysin family protein, partial [Abditibacteriaceae bacterium]